MSFDKAFLLQHKKTVLFSISCLISLMLIYHSVSVFFTLYPPPELKHQSVYSKRSPAKQTKSSKSPTYPLFGEYIPKDSDKRNIPKTLLNLKLLGILKATDKTRSQVIIQIVGGEENVYKLHSTLPGEAKIVRIFDDSVLLLRQGQLEKLSLTRPKLRADINPKPLEFKS